MCGPPQAAGTRQQTITRYLNSLYRWVGNMGTLVTRHSMVEMAVTTIQYLTQEKERVSSLTVVKRVEMVR